MTVRAWTGKLGSEQRRDMLIAVLLIMVIAAFQWSGREDPVTFQFDTDSMTLTGPEGAPFAVELTYLDVFSVSELDELRAGICLDGLSTDRCWFGTWENDAYGTYILCASPSVSRYIVLETAHGVVVCNAQDEDTTQGLYAALVELLEEKGSLTR